MFVAKCPIFISRGNHKYHAEYSIYIVIERINNKVPHLLEFKNQPIEGFIKIYVENDSNKIKLLMLQCSFYNYTDRVNVPILYTKAYM